MNEEIQSGLNVKEIGRSSYEDMHDGSLAFVRFTTRTPKASHDLDSFYTETEKFHL